MKSQFSKTWKSSVQPRKQRKYRYNAPINTQRKFITVNLSKELREKHETRNTKVRKGDKIKVLRGNYRTKTGTVDRVLATKQKIYVTGIELTKRDGSKTKVPLNPTNLQIIELKLDDKKRKEKLTPNKKTEDK